MKVQKLIMIALTGLLVLGCFGAAVAADDTQSAAETVTQESMSPALTYYGAEESSAVPDTDTENITQIRIRGLEETDSNDKVIIITTGEADTSTTDAANSTEGSDKMAASREETDSNDKVIIITTGEPDTSTTDAANSTEGSDKMAASVMKSVADSTATLVEYVIDKSSAVSTLIEEKASRLVEIVENAIESDSDSLNAKIARKAAEEVKGFVKKIYGE